MKVALFEPSDGGHRVTYIKRFVEALAPVADVLVAISDETADAVSGIPAEIVRLGTSAPVPSGTTYRELRAIRAAEIERFHAVAAGVDHAIHLFPDHLLSQLMTAPQAPSPTSLLLFFPRAHYPKHYGSPLGSRERLVATAYELALRRWRRRRDAHAVWTLDEGAARLWARQRGAIARWLPEPPIGDVLVEPDARPREGCVLYGALTDYKGIDRLARSMCQEPNGVRVVLAGAPDPLYRQELDRHVAAMERAGVRLELRARPHTEQEGLAVLAAARCVVLPYRRHVGMSRVLLEAAATGTPVVVHRFGLLGHLVMKHGIGIAVDAEDPAALRAAILELCESQDRTDSFADPLEWFADRYSDLAFRTALRGSLGLEAAPGALSRQPAAGTT